MALVSFSPLTVPFNCPISKKFPEHAVTCSMPWKYGLGFLQNLLTQCEKIMIEIQYA